MVDLHIISVTLPSPSRSRESCFRKGHTSGCIPAERYVLGVRQSLRSMITYCANNFCLLGGMYKETGPSFSTRCNTPEKGEPNTNVHDKIDEFGPLTRMSLFYVKSKC